MSDQRNAHGLHTPDTTPRKLSPTRKPKATTTKRGAARKPRAAKQTKKDKYAIRRILAERPATPGNGGKAYLIDWFPSWELAVCLKNEGDITNEWEMNKESYTFEYGNKRVAKCENPTCDEAEEQCRLMFDIVASEFKKWLVVRGHEKVAQDLFVEEEWVFANNDEMEDAFEKAEEAQDPEPTAAGIMRHTYITMREHNIMPDEDLSNLTYCDIRVRYLGQVDDNFPLVSEIRKRTYSQVKEWLSPLCHPSIRTMKADRWEKEVEMHTKLKELDGVARLFVTRSPFLLKKTHVWPLFFTRLFLKSDEIEELLNDIGVTEGTSQRKIPDIMLSEDWAEETRDWFLQAYSAAFDWEARAVENVERTYLHCRDLVKDRVLRVPKPLSRRNKTKKNAKADKVVMSVLQQSEEDGGEDDPEQDEAHEPEPDEMFGDDQGNFEEE